MIEFLEKYGFNVYSQNREDGVVAEVVRRLDLATGHCVEFGANDGFQFSNTARLLNQGWSGLMIEADWSLYQRCVHNWAHNLNVRVQCSRVDERNINVFVTDKCDLVSLDTDGDDFKIFSALKASPKVVIIEIDSSYPPDVIAFNKDGAGTYRNTTELGISKGYFLLCHTGNLVLVRNDYRDLFPEIPSDGLSNAELYFNRGWLSL